MLDPKNHNDLKLLEKCRQINKEIVSFGVNDKEIIKIIELLSFELEDTDLMRSINSVLKNEPEDIEKENIVIWKETIWQI